MSALTRAIAVRPGEGRAVVLVAGVFAAVEAGRGLGELGVTTLVLNDIGPEILPTLYVGLGLVGLVLSLAYGAALSRSTSRRFFPTLLIVLALILGLEAMLAFTGYKAIYPLIWISVYAAGLLLLTAIWTVGGFVFDARQAKRLFPLLTSAAIVGSLAGFLSAIVVQRITGSEAILVAAEAVLFVVAASLLLGLGPRARPRRAAGASTPSARTALTAGASYVRRSPLMRLVAIAYVLLAVLMFSLEYPFMTSMSERFQKEELLAALAVFSAAVTLVSFLAGTLLANRLYARLGVATVAIALPLMYVAGFGLWIARFTLGTAVIVRFAQQVTQRGLSNAAFSAFYNVIPSARRGQVLAFMDGVPGQLGTVLSGVLLILASQLALEQDVDQVLQLVFWLGLITGLLTTGVLVLMRRTYASSLVATLREGRAEQVLEGGPGLAALGQDVRVVNELRAATTADLASERLLAAELLGRLGATSASEDVRRLIDDQDGGVRRAAISAYIGLGASDPAGATELLTQALADDDARVRATAIELLARLGGRREIRTALAGDLRSDDDPLVRCELAVALARLGDSGAAQALVQELLRASDARSRAAGLDALARMPNQVAPATILGHFDDPAALVRAAAVRAAAARSMGELVAFCELLDDHSAEVRAAAVAALRARPDAVETLLEVLRSGTGRVQDGALAALDGHVDSARAELLAWSEEQVARATWLRGHVLVLASVDSDSPAAYLREVIARREADIEARLLTALGYLGAPEASGLIRRCLRAPDPEVRAQAIEALDSLGDARLARAVVRLLERDDDVQHRAPADVIATITDLGEDRDPWVRVLSLRTLSEHLRTKRQWLTTRVRDDPDPLVREAIQVGEAEDEVPEFPRLVSDIDRMLVLRRVSLFAALEPEDLQRVATDAREQSWAEGDELVTEGELGNELMVIVGGTVRVVHRQDGVEREVRTYGEGDHIGELAVLREAPRAATVVAAAGGVRGLVISGEAIGSLLRERPEAAAAMLATLAERISQQG